MKNKKTPKSNQVEINFESTESYREKTSFLHENNIPSPKVISFSQFVSRSKLIADTELRDFVLQNTKSF